MTSRALLAPRAVTLGGSHGGTQPLVLHSPPGRLLGVVARLHRGDPAARFCQRRRLVPLLWSFLPNVRASTARELSAWLA